MALTLSQQRRTTMQKHVRAIMMALTKTPVDIESLRSLASQGYVDDTIRTQVWPHLLGVDPTRANPNYAVTPSHPYIDQIEKDIIRSMAHMDVTKQIRKKEREQARGALSRIMHTLFTIHPELHYIQGFHDICTVFILVIRDEPLAYLLIERLALVHVRDYLRSNIDTVVQILEIIFPLLQIVDPQVYQFIETTQVRSFFCLSWVLTWFSHNLERLSDCSRLFDFLLASHPLMPMYVATAMIHEMRTGLLQCECEYPAVHAYFQHLPKNLNVSSLISLARKYYTIHPPEQLYQRINHKPKFPSDSPLCVRSVDDLPSHFTAQLKRRRTTSTSTPKSISFKPSTSSSTSSSTSTSTPKHRKNIHSFSHTRISSITSPKMNGRSITNQVTTWDDGIDDSPVTLRLARATMAVGVPIVMVGLYALLQQFI